MEDFSLQTIIMSRFEYIENEKDNLTDIQYLNEMNNLKSLYDSLEKIKNCESLMKKAREILKRWRVTLS